jgi:quinol monooxygenase YgiN
VSELTLVVALRAKPGKEDELRRDLAAVVEPSRKEDGSLGYDLFVDQNDPGRFVFVEHWASRQHRDKHHTEGPHIQHFQANGAKNVEQMEFAYFLDRVV